MEDGGRLEPDEPEAAARVACVAAEGEFARPALGIGVETFHRMDGETARNRELLVDFQRFGENGEVVVQRNLVFQTESMDVGFEFVKRMIVEMGHGAPFIMIRYRLNLVKYRVKAKNQAERKARLAVSCADEKIVALKAKRTSEKYGLDIKLM